MQSDSSANQSPYSDTAGDIHISASTEFHKMVEEDCKDIHFLLSKSINRFIDK